MIPSKTALIATLGSEAQVVTLTLDALLARGEPVSRVIVVHTTPASGPIAEAVSRLRAEFASGVYPTALEFQTQELQTEHGPLADVDSTEGAEGTFRTLYRLVRAEKLAGHKVHLSIAGGRKTMSVFGMAVAQMLFDADDHLWHLVSQGEILAEKRMHAHSGDAVTLVEIPVILWSAVSPVLTDLSMVDDPFEAVKRQRALRLREQLDEARAFVHGTLSGAEQRAVELLVRHGLSNAEIGERLGVSDRTIERQIGEAAAKAAVHWGLPGVNRTQLVTLLGLYYTLR